MREQLKWSKVLLYSLEMIDPSVVQIHLEQGALDKSLCTKPSAVYGERKDIFTPAEVRLYVDQG